MNTAKASTKATSAYSFNTHQKGRKATQAPATKRKTHLHPPTPRSPLQEQEESQSDGDYSSTQEEGETSGEEGEQTKISVETDRTPPETNETTANTQVKQPFQTTNATEATLKQRDQDFPPLTREPKAIKNPQGTSTSTQREPWHMNPEIKK